MSRLWVSGPADSATGVGVYQAAMHPRLARSWDVVEGTARRESFASALRSRRPGALVRQVRGLAREVVPRRVEVDAALCAKPPYPIRRVARRQVLVVLDLRWRRTRSPLARAYRWVDLRLALRVSDGVACISDRVRREFVAAFPRWADQAVVVYLGPGRPPSDAAHPVLRDVDLLVVGGAPHKRAELVLRQIADVGADTWVRSLAVVNPDDTELVLCERLRRGGAEVEVAHRPSDREFEVLLRRCRWVAAFGMEEGFGLVPFEALNAGCRVVAPDNPLNRELFADIGGVTLVPADLPVSVLAKEPIAQAGVAVKERYCWDVTARATEALLTGSRH